MQERGECRVIGMLMQDELGCCYYDYLCNFIILSMPENASKSVVADRVQAPAHDDLLAISR